MSKSSDVLPDLLCRNLDLVICGTAAGPKSAETGFPYSGQGNKFWNILFDTGLTPGKLLPKEYEKLLELGIGLTDLAKRTSGVDSELRSDDFDVEGFKSKLLVYRPYVVGFNGKKAAESYFGKRKVHYGCQSVRLGESILFVLPSTSGANGKHWGPNEKYWHDVTELIEIKRR